MNETTEKKKGKFNFFDALLILLVLALLAGGAPFAILCAII